MKREHASSRDPVNPWHPTQDDDERSSRNRELQRRLSDGGYAAVCYPKEYGGQGLTAAHQKIIDDVSMDFDMPVLFSVPTLSICGPVILEFGTEAQKQRYIPAWIRGDELWVQFISEPSGGSDMAGALTRADRDGDTFVLNGSKIWSTFAQRSDYALLLARTNWDAPKPPGADHVHRALPPSRHRDPPHSDGGRHRGVLPGVLQRRDHSRRERGGRGERRLDGGQPVAVPRAGRGGQRLPPTPRAATATGPPMGWRTWPPSPETTAVPDVGRHRQRLGRMETLSRVEDLLSARVVKGIEGGFLPAPAGSLVRLYHGLSRTRATLRWPLEVQGDRALVWNQGEDTAARLAWTMCSASKSASAAAPPRWPATSSASASSACPANPPPTATSPFNQVPRSG